MAVAALIAAQKGRSPDPACGVLPGARGSPRAAATLPLLLRRLDGTPAGGSHLDSACAPAVIWQLTGRDKQDQPSQSVTQELRAEGQLTHTQIANEAARLLNESGRPLFRHVIVDDGQDLHPAQWRLLRAAVPPGPDDMFIAADPHQRIYDNRVSLTSLGIAIRGRSRRLTMNYRTTQEILAWTVPLLGSAPVTGLDGEADTLLGYRSPMHGPRPELYAATSRDDELAALARRIRSWRDSGIEPHAIGVAARSSTVANPAREALKGAGIPTLALTTQSTRRAARG